MYTDIIRYQKKAELSQDDFLAVCDQVYTSWMKDQPGLQAWKINCIEGDNYVDLVIWESKEHADKAQANMANLDSALGAKWMGAYAPDSIKADQVTQLKRFS